MSIIETVAETAFFLTWLYLAWISIGANWRMWKEQGKKFERNMQLIESNKYENSIWQEKRKAELKVAALAGLVHLFGALCAVIASGTVAFLTFG